MKRTLLYSLIVLLVLLLGYLLVWPVPINPVAWTPPAAPELSGIYEQNNELSKIERLRIDGNKPEDVAFDAQGRIYCGDDTGHLIVADAVVGLLSIAPNGHPTVLATQAGGVPFRCTNDLDVAADGTIYFTDASSKFPLTELKAEFLEHQPNGRFLSYDPRTKETKVLLNDLYFANGVAVSPDQSFVLVNETGTYRIRRYWLKGEQAGQSDIFIDNLPGFPDGISSNGKDLFWVALVNRRDLGLDWLLPHPFLRKIVWRLPSFLQPNIKRYAFALALDLNGKVVRNLQDPSPQCFTQIANVVEHEGNLYFGSIGESAIGRMPVPDK